MKSLMIAIALASCAAVPARAQSCGPTEQVYTQLSEKHGESRVSAGIMQDGIVVEVWANTENGNWTIFATLPNGASCGIASGSNFEMWENFQGKPQL